MGLLRGLYELHCGDGRVAATYKLEDKRMSLFKKVVIVAISMAVIAATVILTVAYISIVNWMNLSFGYLM